MPTPPLSLEQQLSKDINESIATIHVLIHLSRTARDADDTLKYSKAALNTTNALILLLERSYMHRPKQPQLPNPEPPDYEH